MPTPTSIVPDKGVRAKLNSSGSTIPSGRIAKLGATATLAVIAAAATDTLFGVAMSDVDDGCHGDFQTHGKAIVKSGAAVSVGDRVSSDGAGKAITAAPGAGTNHGLLGLAVTATTGADEDLEVELAGPGAVIQG